ncbi:hypothetical protein [Altererythrobacter lutimaris]|uniref:hypothetical protein n=1 Tax=Altererythrobacter lutimaris TaxID=2743979 RepID=UPI0015934A5E|nr:hypothetical protein [Altererythrobacter lutimaris]
MAVFAFLFVGLGFGLLMESSTFDPASNELIGPAVGIPIIVLAALIWWIFSEKPVWRWVAIYVGMVGMLFTMLFFGILLSN